jgi:hypothetical protein
MSVPTTGGRLLAVALLVVSTTVLAAEPSRVVLVRVRSSDAMIARAELRVASELRAAGFVVEERVVDSAADARELVEDDSDSQPFATILMRRAKKGAATDIWVADHVTKKTLVRRVDGGVGEAGTKTLALRVVELMRASLVEPIVLPPPVDAPPPPPPPRDVATWALPEPPKVEPAVDAPERLELEAGFTALYASASFGAAFGPSLTVGLPFGDRFVARAVVLGPVFGSRVDAVEGSATVRQELALGELAYSVTPRDAGVRATLGLGAGAYHLSAQGNAAAPFVGASDDLWSALAAASLGASVRLAPHARVDLSGRALFAFPRPTLAFASADVASGGRPALALSLGLEVDL